MKLTNFYKISIDQIHSDQNFNCRKEITQESILELAQSIEIHGLQSPIHIEKKENLPDGCLYRIIAGHRRYEACKYLGFKIIDARIIEVKSEEQAKLLNFSENIDRKNLSPYEEALALVNIFPKDMPLRKMSKILNKSYEWCRRRKAILDYPQEIQLAFHEGFLGIRDIISLATLKKDVREEAARRLVVERKKGNNIPKGSVRQRIPHRNTNEIKKMINYFQRKKFKDLPIACLRWVLGFIDDKQLKKITREYKNVNS